MTGRFPPMRVWPVLPPTMHLASRRAAPYPLEEPGCVLYARARHGLADGLRALGIGPGACVLMPSWHHGSEVQAVLSTGATCAFYEVGADLQPQEDELEALMSSAVMALHLTHFLGFPQDGHRWRRWCDERGIALVEDAAQAWLAQRDGVPTGAHGDLAVWCLYKSIGVPDGAAVLCRDSLPRAPDGALGLYGVVRRHAAWLEQVVPVPFPRSNRAAGTYDPVEDMAQGACAGPSRLSARLLDRFGCGDAAAVARARRTRFEIWRRALSDWLPAPWNVPLEGAAPLVFPLAVGRLVPERALVDLVDMVEKDAVLEALRDRGVEGLDLWRHAHPAVRSEMFPRASWLRRHLVGLPVHQGLSERHVERAAARMAEWCSTSTEMMDAGR